jgi:hypothetical protein
MAQARGEVVERDREGKRSGNENGKTDFIGLGLCDVDCEGEILRQSSG